MSRSSNPVRPVVTNQETGERIVVDNDWFHHDRAEREWFSVLHEGLGYEVLAYSPAKAQAYFLLWHETPVEVNWIRRYSALDKPQ